MTKHKTDSGWKSRYYAVILSGKEDHSLWNASIQQSTLQAHGQLCYDRDEIIV